MFNTISRQFPFATYKAINRTILEMQRYQRYHQRRVFEIRKKQYWDQSVKILQFAKVSDLTGVMGIDPKGKVPKFDIWRRQEYGGRREPTFGRKRLAIPPQEESQFSPVGLQRLASGLIPARMRPSKLKRTFLVPFKDGKFGVFQRLGRRQKGFTKTAPGQRFGLKDDPNVQLMWILHESAEIEPVYEFFGNAKKTYDSKWNRYFNEELVRAFRTARIGSR